MRKKKNFWEYVNYLKRYWKKSWLTGKIPREQVEEYVELFGLPYSKTYNIMHEASWDLAMETQGEIVFRWNVFDKKWRFHLSEQDFLDLTYGDAKRQEGHLHTSHKTFEMSKTKFPIIKKKIRIIKARMIDSHTIDLPHRGKET